MFEELKTELSNLGIYLNNKEPYPIFTSIFDRFVDFSIESEIFDWTLETDQILVEGLCAYFPGVKLLIKFKNSSFLLVYASGHIRWITFPGLVYYARLTKSRPPSFIQGDVMIYGLSHTTMLQNRDSIRTLLPSHQGSVWCRYNKIPEYAIENWCETSLLYVGGNQRHCLYGHVQYCAPIRDDHRTVQIITKEQVTIQHTPVDEIHPTIFLPKGQSYLITKMPGFSNPGSEYEREKNEMPQ